MVVYLVVFLHPRICEGREGAQYLLVVQHVYT
jgi:hypothetical protein